MSDYTPLWTFDAHFEIKLSVNQVEYEQEVSQKINRAPRYYATMWTSHPADGVPKQWLISLDRKGTNSLVPSGYHQRQVNSEAKWTPWSKMTFSSTLPGIATAAGIEVMVRRETLSHDDRIASDDVGSTSVRILDVATAALRAPGPFGIRSTVALHATKDPVAGVMLMTVTNARFDADKLVEVYSTEQEPDVQAVVNQPFCSLGWQHIMPSTDDIKVMDSLLPIGNKAIVPQCNMSAGVIPVDLFFGIRNSPTLPIVNESDWMRIANNAFWTRSLTAAKVEQLLDDNLDRKYYRPEFETVVSAFAKMFTGTANALPYRSDTMRMRDKEGRLASAGTDYFRNALCQMSGDCEDVAKLAHDMFDSFVRYKGFKSPVLQKLQRLADCYNAQAQLLVVTSAKLETDEKATQHKFVPIEERQCGLHAAVVLRPRPEKIAMLARGIGKEQAEKLYTGERPPPPVAASVGMCQLEGTGNMDSRLMPRRQYVMRAAEHHPDDAEIAEKLASDDEARVKATVSVFKATPKLWSSIGARPEMGQFSLNYKYDYDAIWKGDIPSASHFYMFETETFDTTAMDGGGRNCRFMMVTMDSEGKPDSMKTMGLFDAFLNQDERIALVPQPGVTDSVVRATNAIVARLEPTPFTDAHPDLAGPDVLLKSLANEFGTDEREPPSGRDATVAVDMYVYNWRVDADARAKEASMIKKKVLAIDGVEDAYFKLLHWNAGLVTGAIRMWVKKDSII